MKNGIVRWFDHKKGYGFIQADGKDYFTHFKEIQSEGFKTLNEGDKVRFTESSSPKGPVAIGVYLGHE